MVDEGDIGEVLELRGWGKEDHRGGGEDLWVLGSRVMNLMSSWLPRGSSGEEKIAVLFDRCPQNLSLWR